MLQRLSRPTPMSSQFHFEAFCLKLRTETGTQEVQDTLRAILVGPLVSMVYLADHRAILVGPPVSAVHLAGPALSAVIGIGRNSLKDPDIMEQLVYCCGGSTGATGRAVWAIFGPSRSVRGSTVHRRRTVHWVANRSLSGRQIGQSQ